jgi:hypothetical protein
MIRLHDLRHTAITNAISQGEDIMLVAAFAGHAKTSTTVDVYSHLLPKRAHEAARRMRSVSLVLSAQDPERRHYAHLDATSRRERWNRGRCRGARFGCPCYSE